MQGYVAQHFEYVKSTHTKSQNFENVSGKPDDFLLSKNLSIEEKQNLFKAKSHMLSVKSNFKNGNKHNLFCEMCTIHYQTQQHLFKCPKIVNKLKNKEKFQNTSYEHMQGTIAQQEQFGQVLTMILKTREEMINTETPNGDLCT